MSSAGTIHLIKRGKVFIPADQHAEEYIDKLPPDAEIVVKRQSVKNPKEVRWYFAMLRKALDQTDRFSSTDELRDALMIATGNYTWRHDIYGRHIQVANSLAEMDLDAFREHKEKALDLIASELGIDARELMREADGTQKVARY